MKILKPGESGYGFLVEYDSGYISPELTCADGTCSNDRLIREFKTNLSATGELPDIIEVYAVLQKWGVENKNGRVYPKDTKNLLTWELHLVNLTTLNHLLLMVNVYHI